MVWEAERTAAECQLLTGNPKIVDTNGLQTLPKMGEKFGGINLRVEGNGARLLERGHAWLPRWLEIEATMHLFGQSRCEKQLAHAAQGEVTSGTAKPVAQMFHLAKAGLRRADCRA